MDVNFLLQGIHFQWNVDKADSNLWKHGVSFEKACEVFFDPFFYPLKDDEVGDELRDVVIGLTASWRTLYVVYTMRDDVIRIISARPVTRLERLHYENQ